MVAVKWACLWFLIAFLIGSYCTEAKRKKSKASKHNLLLSQPQWKPRRHKNSECRLGGNRYALNTTWNPDLGPPFGVWNCVKCTCNPVRKKRRVVAKVACVNVKNQCPKVTCNNPFLAPGECCKLCPGQKATLNYEFGMQREEPTPERLNNKEFAVLLNGRTSKNPDISDLLATGRFLLRRGTLHFSFVLDPLSPLPPVIQFLNPDGNILEEIEVQPTPYEVNNGRVCGTWTRVPHQYRTLLKREELWVAFSGSNETDVISGQIKRYKGVETEVFSSLLAPIEKGRTFAGGGTAIISVSPLSDSLHISLVFNGIFLQSEFKNITLHVELIPSRSLDPVRETIFLEKVYSDINEVDFMTTLGETSLRLLTRGKISMKVWSASAPNLGIEGPVIARATCNVFSTVLTSAPSQGRSLYGSGWALLFISNEGDFEYQIKMEDLPSPITSVTFETTGKRRVREVEDLTKNYKHEWVNGTYTKPTFRDLDMLMRKRLDISVSLENGQLLLGTFELISVTEALRTMYPTLLRSPTFWMAATAWIDIDSACVMHYDVYLGGNNPWGSSDPTWRLLLHEEDKIWDPRLDLNNITLEHMVTGRDIASHNTLLTKISLTRLMHGASKLELTVADSRDVFHPNNKIVGTIQNVKVPNHCLVGDGWSPSKSSADKLHDIPCQGLLCLLDQTDDSFQVKSNKCIDDEKVVYEDGETWRSPLIKCQRCMCTLGKIQCQQEPCPTPSCSSPITLPGQCCPSCPIQMVQMSERVCVMDKESHSIGAYWHPFLAPKGFNLCVTCRCELTEDYEPRIQCDWMKCPTLPCSGADTELVEGSCCRKCKTQQSSASSVRGMVSDVKLTVHQNEMKEISKAILADGGCHERGDTVRKNGESWQPKLNFKHVKWCINCHCKDGKMSCKRGKCHKSQKGRRRKHLQQRRKTRHKKLV